MKVSRAALVLMVLTVAACGRPKDQTTGSLDPAEAMQKREAMPAALQAQLDSGSAAFRGQNMQEALRHYTAATEIDGEVAAAWFGVYMAQKALGNTQEALTALERVQSLAPGASLVQPDGEGGS